MKSDIDIKDDLYQVLSASPLITGDEKITGQLSKTLRPLDSQLEDVVVSIRANAPTQRQEATVYVNVYVQDRYIDGQYEEDTQRMRTLAQLCLDTLSIVSGQEYYCHLEEQRVEAAEDGREHIITNKLTYQVINE